MPPFVSKKRHKSPSPPPPQKRAKIETPTKVHQVTKAAKGKATSSKSGIFDLVDKPSPPSNKKLPEGKIFADVDDSDMSEQSDVDSDEFEDVVHAEEDSALKDGKDDEASDEHDDWEDVDHKAVPEQLEAPGHDTPTEALELTLGGKPAAVSYVDLTGKKAGPSRRDKKIRFLTHRVHVQFLMWHNHTRNHWLNDKNVQKTMVKHLEQSQKMKLQLENWRRRSGFETARPKKEAKVSPKDKGKSKDKGRGRPSKEDDPRSKRDWAEAAERQAAGQADLSRGDPVLPLLNTMAAWWRQRFTIVAPALRKRGYKPMRALKEELTEWRNAESDITDHGESIRTIGEFRSCASRCEGSRDVGAQLFVALLRGLGIETRLVASLQPLGFGWNKLEDAEPNKKKNGDATTSANGESAKSKGKQSKVKAPRASAEPTSKAATVELSDTSDLSDVDSLEYDSDVSIVDITPKKKANMPYDNDMLFPTYWAEVVSPVTSRVFPVDPFVLRPPVATSAEHLALFEARGSKAEKARQVFAYVVAFSPDYSGKDVTTRYLKKHIWPGKTKGVRLPPDKVPVADENGKVVAYYEIDWWRSVMRSFQRQTNQQTKAEAIEDEAELRPVQPEKKMAKEGDPDTLDGYKRSEKFVLERHLRREEALLPRAQSVKTFRTGKGEKTKDEPVYLRRDVVVCRTSESWHKEGRQIKEGEQPLKMVPVRAVTLTRKREIEEAERETGEKATQGMYGQHQTDWIIPPPIKDGVIPKNAYGNMDAFVPQMIPAGAIHLPMMRTKQVCKKLDIDYAEAVTGFEFGNKMAVPVIQGVVVAEENKDLVLDAWHRAEEERKIKEEAKKEKEILSTWRKFLMGLRVLERMKEEYEINMDDEIKERNPFTNRKKQRADSVDPVPEETIVEGIDEQHEGGGFLLDKEEEGGGFVPEGRDEEIPVNVDTKPAHSLDIEHEDSPQKLKVSQRGKAMSLAELAAQRDANSDEEGQESEDEPAKRQKAKPAATRKTTTSKTSQANGKGKGRSSGRTPKKKQATPEEATLTDDDDEEEEEEEEEASLPSREVVRQRTPAKQTPRPTRASTRSAAKTSSEKTRSHYFRHSSTAEEDSDGGEGESDSSVEMVPKKGTGRGRGRRRGRGKR